MRWGKETFDEYDKRVRSWHDWFAWYPVSCDGHIMWMETVQRQLIANPYPYNSPIWIYRPKDDT